ncbi:MAG: cytochrome C biogenesis protein [Calditrichaeota bacterium]|nr:MAG: cytochrome C biogenesis protein [Calditrichota bacterium]
MIEELFTNLTIALSARFAIALTAAFGWGVISILLSPCHLSSIPLVIGYISSQGEIRIKHSFFLALVFSIGTLITIAVLGLVTASMGRLMGDVGQWGNWLVASIFIVIGLYLMDIIRLDWSGNNLVKKNRSGLWGAFVLGLIFGIGLGPCTFAFLAPVLGIVFQNASENWPKAMLLISAFGIGHCAVIVAAGSLTNFVQKYLNWVEVSKTSLYIKKLAGFFVLLGGIYFIYSL